MKLAFCVACGSTDELQHHHLVTRGEGSSNDERNFSNSPNGRQATRCASTARLLSTPKSLSRERNPNCVLGET